MKILGTLLVFGAMTGAAFGAVATPEIDPASGVAALVLLGGGLLVLRSRRGRAK